MPTFAVIRKSDGCEVYRYAHAAPVEWAGMEFATHDHDELAEQPGETSEQPQGHRMTKLAFLRRFTAPERVAMRGAAAQNPYLADYMALLELAEDIDTSDADTVAGVNMLEAAGLLAAGRAGEILNG